MLSSTSLTPSSTSSPFNFSPATSTTSSQSSQSSAPVKSSRNLLTDLQEAESTYMATLRIIDSQIAPLWMKQTAQAVPEFTELIKHVRDLVMVNKQFAANLSKYTNNAPHSGQALGDTLMQWVHDLEVPYANYARSYIPNLNNRQDILANRSINQLLKDLSTSASYDISLESLFNAPIQQLKYYHGLYTRLLDSADVSRPDYKPLVDATKRLDTILALAPHQVKMGHPTLPSTPPPPPAIQTDMRPAGPKKKKSFVRQEDFFAYYTESGEVSPLESSSDEDDSFEGYGRSSGNSSSNKKAPAEDLANIQPRSVKILPQVPAVPPAPQQPSEPMKKVANGPPPAQDAVQMTYIKPATARIDLPMASSAAAPAGPAPNAGHVDAVRAALTTGPPSPQQQRNLTTPSPTTMESPTRPVSPRAVQVQQAVTPVAAMQAMPQKTNDYFSMPKSGSVGGGSPQLTPSQSSPQQAMLPRTSSKRNNNNNAGNPPSERSVAVNVDPTARVAASNRPPPPPAMQQQSPQPRPGAPHARPQFSPSSPTQQQQPFPGCPPMQSYGAGGAPLPPNKNGMPLARSSSRNTDQQQGMPPGMPPQFRPNGPPSPHHPHQGAPPPPGMMHAPRPLPPGPQPPFQQQQQQQPPMQQMHAMGGGHRPPPSPGGPMRGPPPPHVGFAPGPHGGPSGAPMPPPPNMSPSRSLGTRTPPPTNGNMMVPPLSPRTPPPSGMDDAQHGVKQVLFNNNQCEVFHWKAQSWYAVEGKCTIQVRLTFNGRSCLAVQLQPSGQMYLNAWILASMVISQPSPTDVSVSVTMMAKQENYLMHFNHPAEASNLLAMLQRMHHEARTNPDPPQRSSPNGGMPSAVNLRRQETTAVELRDDTPSVEDVPQTLKPVFQCKLKLFVQSETSKWTPMGSTAMRISQQLPSQKMHIYIQDDKNKLVSSVVRSGNVERLSTKRLTFLLTDEKTKTSIVYLVQVKDEKTGTKIYEYLKTQNAAHGW
ncbi:hypothetical protein BC940DRAFT_293451 [Gongronella butleri]|nr:hypothetical protein BC940DRAFT_293451 [Gongronella butleri]